MGPTNVALVKLFQAESELREAQRRLEAATKNVRIQERRTRDLSDKLSQLQGQLKEKQAASGNLELDLKTRDAHIEKLRTQQQNAKNNKEYQAFLIEINTEKVDKGKVEEEAIKVMEAVETLQKQVSELSTQLSGEQAKLQTMKGEITNKVAELQGEIDRIQPKRDEAAAAVPPRARDAFERLAERMEGEAMAAIQKTNPRKEEYACSECHMSLVTDIYNRLHSRDDLVFCPSCHRILYIPADLPPEVAVKARKQPKEKSNANDTAPASEEA